MTPRSFGCISTCFPDRLFSSSFCPYLAQTYPVSLDYCCLLQRGLLDSHPTLPWVGHHSAAVMTYKIPDPTIPTLASNFPLKSKIVSRHSWQMTQCRAHHHTMNIPHGYSSFNLYTWYFSFFKLIPYIAFQSYNGYSLSSKFFVYLISNLSCIYLLSPLMCNWQFFYNLSKLLP